MTDGRVKEFSGPVSVFHELRLPEEAQPAGYAALIDGWGLQVPLPRMLYAIGMRHRILRSERWRILTPRHAPEPTLTGHLVFALKYEGIDLAVLKRLFIATGPHPIESIIGSTPTGSYARRIWFLYEWLTGDTLAVPNAQRGSYVPVLDPRLQVAGNEERSPSSR